MGYLMFLFVELLLLLLLWRMLNQFVYEDKGMKISFHHKMDSNELMFHLELKEIFLLRFVHQYDHDENLLEQLIKSNSEKKEYFDRTFAEFINPILDRCC